MVGLAGENGYQKIDTWRGSGHLLLTKMTPRRSCLVAYEIAILFNPATKIAAAVGSMVGNRDLLERAKTCGKARLSYAPGKAAEIQILYLEPKSAYFKVLSRIGI